MFAGGRLGRRVPPTFCNSLLQNYRCVVFAPQSERQSSFRSKSAAGCCAIAGESISPPPVAELDVNTIVQQLVAQL